MSLAATISEKLTKRFRPLRLKVIDESHQHAGHAAMKGLNPVESHFAIEILSTEFNGMSKLQRQRAVYAALDEEVKNKIHALRMACEGTEDGAQ